MSSAYYYFAASLPIVEFGQKPPMTTDSFLEECKRLLAERDFRDIENALQDKGVGVVNRFLKTWQRFERCLRNELVILRARQLNKEPRAYLHGERSAEAEILDAIQQAVKSSDPLSAERILDQTRWQKLDEWVQGHFFDLEFLISYALKLKILNRYEQINSKRGSEDFFKYKQEFVNKQAVFA